MILHLKSIEHVVFKKKLKTLDDGRKPIAVGHLSDSGDIQIYDT